MPFTDLAVNNVEMMTWFFDNGSGIRKYFVDP
ncbi:hypothetical protein ACUXI4_004336 [Pantoea piersonii]